MDVVVVEASSTADREICLAIRQRVFVAEQAVPAALELDGLDDESTHFLAWRGGLAAGCARMRVRDGQAKVERVAVLQTLRRAGIGRALMDALEARARRRGLARVVLHAQLEAVPFYERLGYARRGEVFHEAGIPHLAMQKGVGDNGPGGS